MNPFHTFVLLMFMAVLLVGAAQKIRIPYPIALILGGGLIGFMPNLAPILFDPKILLIIVLPPILFYASFSISYKEFLRYFSDIFSLAIVLVIITTVVMALLFKWLFPDLSWPLAFAFGAIVSPPDAVAATTILKRFAISSRLETILEGESLINDASALVIYKFAVLAMTTGFFSLGSISWEVAYVVGGGILLGLITGYILSLFTRFLNPVLIVVYSFIIPYVTYCLADFLETSGVLAVVINGLLGSRRLVSKHSPLTRVLGWASWDILIILLNCFIFILIGLEFSHISKNMSFEQFMTYSAYGLLLTLVIILTRFAGVYGRRGIWHLRIRKDALLVQQSKTYLLHAIITSWSGMRGIVSLTAALALPLTIRDGSPLEGRDIVIFLTFEIIFLTLVIPGLTLPMLIRWLKIRPIQTQDEALKIREKLAVVAKDEIQKLYILNHLDDEEKEILNMYFNSRHKIQKFISISEEHKVEQARHRIVQTQRDHLMEMWVQNEVNDELMNHLSRELDLEEAHLVRGNIA